MGSDDKSLKSAAAALGSRGGKASAKALSKEERRARASRAGRAAALSLSAEERAERAKRAAGGRWKKDAGDKKK